MSRTEVDLERKGVEQEICLNAVGIVVGLCMFLVAQMILVFAFAHFWQRGRARAREKAAIRDEEDKRNMFNPYTSPVRR